MKKLFYSLLILTVLISSCKKKDEAPTPPTPPTEYILDRIELMSTSEVLEFTYDGTIEKYTSVTLPNNRLLEYIYDIDGNCTNIQVSESGNLKKENIITYNNGLISQIEKWESEFGNALEIKRRIIYTYNTNEQLKNVIYQVFTSGLSAEYGFVDYYYDQNNHKTFSDTSYWNPLTLDTVFDIRTQYETENGVVTSSTDYYYSDPSSPLITGNKIDYTFSLGKLLEEEHFTWNQNTNPHPVTGVNLGAHEASIPPHEFIYDYENIEAKLFPPNRSMGLLIRELLDPSVHPQMHGTLGGHTFRTITGPTYMLHYYYAEL